MSTALDRAIQAANGPSGLARALRVKPNVVGMWRIRSRVPAGYVLAIERATNGVVSRYDLRPDVFGERRSGPQESGATGKD